MDDEFSLDPGLLKEMSSTNEDNLDNLENLNSTIYCDEIDENEENGLIGLLENPGNFEVMNGNLYKEEVVVLEEVVELMVPPDEKEDDLSNHEFQIIMDGNSILKYFCPQCDKDYDSVNEFTLEHNVSSMEEDHFDVIPMENDEHQHLLPTIDEKSCSSWVDFDANELIEEQDDYETFNGKIVEEVVVTEEGEGEDVEEEETTILFDPSVVTGMDEECLFYCNKCHHEYNESSLESGEHKCYTGLESLINPPPPSSSLPPSSPLSLPCPSSQNKAIDDNEFEIDNELESLLSFTYSCAHCSKKFTSAESRLKHAGKCFNLEKVRKRKH